MTLHFIFTVNSIPKFMYQLGFQAVENTLKSTSPRNLKPLFLPWIVILYLYGLWLKCLLLIKVLMTLFQAANLVNSEALASLGERRCNFSQLRRPRIGSQWLKALALSSSSYNKQSQFILPYLIILH